MSFLTGCIYIISLSLVMGSSPPPPPGYPYLLYLSYLWSWVRVPPGYPYLLYLSVHGVDLLSESPYLTVSGHEFESHVGSLALELVSLCLIPLCL